MPDLPPPPVPPSAGPFGGFPPPDGPPLDAPVTPTPTISNRHLHPLSPLLSGVFGLLRVWPIALLAVARGAVIGLVALAVALVVWRWLVWLRTTWELDASALVVRSGILWRSVQTVPPQRVQQVEVRQALRHRATGLAVVRIGLAGGGESNEVELDALTLTQAERLGEVLEGWRTVTSNSGGDAARADASMPAVATGPPLVAVPLWQLVVAGLSGKSLWLAPLAGFAAFVQFLSDTRLDDDATGAVRDRITEMSPAFTLTIVTVLALGAAAVSTVVSNYGLTVTRAGADLRVRRGLLEQRSAVVPVGRVQSVELATNVIRERFGLASLDMRTADLGGSGGEDSSTSVVIGGREDLVGLAREVLPSPTEVPLDRHPPAAVRREVFRRARRLVPLAAVVALAVGGLGTVAPAAAVALVVAVSTGILAGRRLRSGRDATNIVTERGLLARRRWIVPIDRVQSVGVVQNPFQRRLGLASVRLDVAGSPGGVVLRDLGADEAGRVAESVTRTWTRSPDRPI